VDVKGEKFQVSLSDVMIFTILEYHQSHLSVSLTSHALSFVMANFLEPIHASYRLV
jgi:hypothetical protein